MLAAVDSCDEEDSALVAGAASGCGMTGIDTLVASARGTKGDVGGTLAKGERCSGDEDSCDVATSTK